tara:strand:- start:750 stop:1058 length:309 start_codon:yes stop_codon:yes gene_type:complete
MQVVAIGDILTIRTLQLLGVPGTVVSTPREAVEKLREQLADNEPVMLLLPTTLAQNMGDEVKKVKSEVRGKSIVIEIPDVTGSTGEIEETLQLVSKTIGISL